MFEVIPGTGWLFLAYVVGTLFGMYVGWQAFGHKIVEMTIDSLIENGFLKTQTNKDTGELEIIKYND